MSEQIYYATTEYSPIMGFTGFTFMDPLSLNSVDGLKKVTEQFLEKSKHLIFKNMIQISNVCLIIISFLKPLSIFLSKLLEFKNINKWEYQTKKKLILIIWLMGG